MFISFLSYPLIVIATILLYSVSIGQTLISLVRYGLRKNRLKVLFHCLVIFTIIALNFYHSEIYKSKRILTATLKDDQFIYTLIFRENGNCENEVSGIFGFQETYYGKYKINKDTIIFQKKPYDNDFIPDTLLVDKKSKAIFLHKNKDGKFSRAKEWLNFFELQ